MMKDDTIYWPENDKEREILKVEGIAYFRGYKAGQYETGKKLNEIKPLINAVQRVIDGRDGEIQDLMDNLEVLEDALYRVKKVMAKDE